MSQAEKEAVERLRRNLVRDVHNRRLAQRILAVPDQWLDEYIDVVTRHHIAQGRKAAVR